MSNYEDFQTCKVGPSVKGKEKAAITTPWSSIEDSSYDDGEQIECTEKLILRLLKEDRDEFVESQKNKKQPFGADAELSLSTWNEELLNAERIFDDRSMALSISNAAAVDQHLLAENEEAEQMGRTDHVLALHLSGCPTDTSNLPTPRFKRNDETSDPLFNTISSLAKQSVSQSTKNHTRYTASPSGAHNVQHITCIVCTSTIEEPPMTDLACNHVWCRDCLREIFSTATRDEQLYPPRCCGNVFPPSLAMRLLDYSELTAFCKAGVEFAATNRLYCGDQSCSAFIPKWLVKGERAQCERCQKPTHTICMMLGEPDHDCPSDENLKKTLSLAVEKAWKRCTKCKALVENRYGCNHITCRCGAEFCYKCGSTWKSCNCALWHYDDLTGIAQHGARV